MEKKLSYTYKNICMQYMNLQDMRDINTLRDCALYIWTGMLFHKIAPL